MRKRTGDRIIPGRRKQWAPAVLLTALLLFGSLFSPPALAQTSAWHALQEALDRAKTGEVITLTEDVTAPEGEPMLTVDPGRHITLDLNGHTLSRDMQVFKNVNGCVLFIEEGAVLTLRDSGETPGMLTGGLHIGLEG